MSGAKDKKVLICGVGSIGERHIRNLITLGYHDIILYRQRNLPLRTIEREFSVFNDLSAALEQKPDVAFICNPTVLHTETALQCIEHGCHIFVEKPLGINYAQVKCIEDALRKQSVQCMVGYMMRFHPCMRAAKSWIEAGKIGKILYYRSQWGEYLPNWHPYEDYRETYAALKDLGGGPTLTLSHELDLLAWFLGEPAGIVALKNTSSNLELTTEHGVDALFRFEEGATAHVHLDFFRRPPTRNLEIVGDLGCIKFDYFANQLVLKAFEGDTEISKTETINAFDRNQMFIDEVEYFFDQLVKSEKIIPGLAEGSVVAAMTDKIFGSCNGHKN